MQSIRDLYNYAKSSAWGDDQKVVISGHSLAALVAYAESIGVRAGHDQHSAVIKECRAKAKKMRYHNMAEKILPECDYLYDSRYSEATEYADWEVQE